MLNLGMKRTIMTMALALSLPSFASNYEGSSFDQVWDKISEFPYQTLPQKKVSSGSILSGIGKRLMKSANRTLSDRSDMLPHFEKLVHPNGVCLAGTWNIDSSKKNHYSGYFKNGSKGLIIARASTALSNTKQGGLRAFGLAGKIFPTTDSGEVVETANFFTVDDLGGTKASHFTGVELTNEPPISKTSDMIRHLSFLMKVMSKFKKADGNPGFRPLYEISKAGLINKKGAITPRWMKLKARNGQKVDRKDFRDELNVSNYGGNLIFDIFVANTEDIDTKEKLWIKVGHIDFTESAASPVCDHRLHFHHPKLKK